MHDDMKQIGARSSIFEVSRAYCLAVAADFADHVDRVGDMGDLHSLLEATTRDLGFAYYALVEHVDLERPPSRILLLHNYPEAWVRTFAERGFYGHDPVQAFASFQTMPFAWSDLYRRLKLSSLQREILDDASEMGLRDGYTVPLHAPFGRKASASFVPAQGRRLPRPALLAVQCIGHSAFQAAMAMLATPGVPSRLSRRQRQCVALVALGKSDWEIGIILGLSEETVTKYLKAARRRFGVNSRTQLALAALASGELSLDEILSWQ